MAAHSDPHPTRSAQLFMKGCTRKVLGVHRNKHKNRTINEQTPKSAQKL